MNNATQYQLTASIKHYIYPLLLELQLGCCAGCGLEYEYYEVDHMRYADDLTVYDLQLLCVACHDTKTRISHEQYLYKMKHCPSCTCQEGCQ